METERAHRRGKTMIDGAPNKKRTFIAKFLNFKDKQEVLSKYKAQKVSCKEPKSSRKKGSLPS